MFLIYVSQMLWSCSLDAQMLHIVPCKNSMKHFSDANTNPSHPLVVAVGLYVQEPPHLAVLSA